MLTVHVSPNDSGIVYVNGELVPYYPYTFVYEEVTEILLEAFPTTGYDFVRWSGCVNETSNPASVLIDTSPPSPGH